MLEPLLRIDALQAWYGPSQALHGATLAVQDGEFVTLLGRNGAGKSTLLKTVMGIVEKSAGHVSFRGEPIRGLAPHHIGRRGIAYCPDDRGICASLGVLENLLLPPVVAAGGMSLDELFALFPNLAQRRTSNGTQLSGGEQQMLAIARILRTGAKLLLLDEPTEGLAPVIVERLGTLFELLKTRGYTVVLVEQNVHFAAALGDRHYLIETGRVVDEFDASTLRANLGAVTARLGV